MIHWNAKNRTLVVKLPRFRRRRLALGVAAFLAFNILVSYIDLPLAEWMSALDPQIIALFGLITKAGDSKYYLITLALLLPFLLAARQAIEPGSVRRMLSWSAASLAFIFASVAVSGLLVNLIKIIVGRTRPKLWFSEGLYGISPFSVGESAYYSFPSGHANTVFALAITLAFFMPRLRALLLTGAIVIAFSRVVITAHYLSDILVGGLLGVATSYWLRDFVTRRGWIFVKRHGQYCLQAPGYLLGQKLRAQLWRRLGWIDGARGRLPM